MIHTNLSYFDVDIAYLKSGNYFQHSLAGVIVRSAWSCFLASANQIVCQPNLKVVCWANEVVIVYIMKI